MLLENSWTYPSTSADSQRRHAATRREFCALPKGTGRQLPLVRAVAIRHLGIFLPHAVFPVARTVQPGLPWLKEIQVSGQ